MGSTQPCGVINIFTKMPKIFMMKQNRFTIMNVRLMDKCVDKLINFNFDVNEEKIS